MHIGGVKRLSDTHVDLVAMDIRKSPLDRFPHGTVGATSHPEFSGTRRAANFQTIQTDFAMIVHRSRIDRTWGERISGDEITPAFFWHPHVALFTGVIVDVRERGLM